MSTVKATQMQTDTLVAKDGLGLPNNLLSLTPFCYGTIQSRTLVESVNVSSIEIGTSGIKVNMINNASSVNYVVLATRDGDESAKIQSVTYFRPSGASAKTTNAFSLIPKADTSVETDAGEISFLVVDKGQTV